MKILQLIPNLRYTGAAKQLAMLGIGLPSDRFQVQVAVLQSAPESGIAALLKQHGIAARVLGQGRRFDPLCLWRLRQLLRSSRPDLVHVWGDSCLRWVTLAAPRSVLPMIVTDALASPRMGGGALWERWLLRKPNRIIARGQTEADRYLRAGVPPAKIIRVAPVAATLPFPHEPGQRHLFQAGRRFVLCAGSLEIQRGFRNAIWSLDILRIIFEDLNLLVLGDGPERDSLQRFAKGIQLAERVHFLGPRADIRPFLDLTELVWVPSLEDCGVAVTLESQAAGKPVVASNVPRLREIIRDGETGFLIPPGDKVALGRRTSELLRNPDLARRMGEGARRRVAPFTPARLIERYAEIYVEAAA
jgi:glycosyltransferase involved in cell wall biosynthesis